MATVEPHRMVSRDLGSLTGECSVCGPVTLAKRCSGGYTWYACGKARAASHQRNKGVHVQRMSDWRTRNIQAQDKRFITVEDILEVLASTCPICDVEMVHGNGRKGYSFTLDRIDSTRGYVPGNIAVICFRCNRIKADGTPEDHRRIADWMEKNAYLTN
jgi:ssDNA-binding Zn-finger/Zn-ribbon topoisomerase 1